MIAYSKNVPQITQYDANTVAVPISISETSFKYGDTEEPMYQYEEYLVPASAGFDAGSKACVKAFINAAIKAKHAEIINEGYLSSLGFRVDINRENVIDWSAALQLLQMTKAQTIDICDFDNKTHTLTADQYAQLCSEIGAYLSQLRSYKWSVRANIDAAKTIDASHQAGKWEFQK